MTLTDQQRQRAFADSITFDAFVAGVTHFVDDFRPNYQATALDEQDRALLAVLPGPIDVLAIVEHWCPDVVANLPIVARIADDTAALRLHVLVRDDAHRDIADAYPYEGRSHIPTYVLFGSDGEQLGVIVERPGTIRTLVAGFLDDFFASHPELDRTTFPAGLDDETRAELTGRSIQLRREHRDLERSSLIAEIHGLVLEGSTPAAV